METTGSCHHCCGRGLGDKAAFGLPMLLQETH